MDFSRNHFELFGLPQTYALDRDRLDAAYRELQQAVHPDRFAARGIYLLSLQGIDALHAGNTKMAPAFLMQQMEWRETVEAARAGRNVEMLDELGAELRSEHRRIEAELAALIDEAQDYEAATEAVRQLRFMDKLIAEVGDVYEELET